MRGIIRKVCGLEPIDGSAATTQKDKKQPQVAAIICSAAAWREPLRTGGYWRKRPDGTAVKPLRVRRGSLTVGIPSRRRQIPGFRRLFLRYQARIRLFGPAKARATAIRCIALQYTQLCRYIRPGFRRTFPLSVSLSLDGLCCPPRGFASDQTPEISVGQTHGFDQHLPF